MSPLAGIALAFALGIVVSRADRLLSPGMALGIASLLLSLALISFWRSRRKASLFLLLCFTALGFTWGELSRASFPASLRPFLGHYVKLEGTLDALPVEYPNRISYVFSEPVVALGRDAWKGRERVQVVLYRSSRQGLDKGMAGRPPEARLLPGCRARVAGRLDLPPLPSNPGDFDYRAYLGRKGIVAVLNAEAAPSILGEKSCFSRLLASVRLEIEDGIRSSLPSHQAALLSGFLLGSTEGIGPDDRQIYQRTGVMHLFAVSGLNVGFVLLLFLAAGRLLRLGRSATFILVSLGVWSYAAITCFPASVTRAAVMGTVGLGASLWQQRQNLQNSLALAALAILLADPSSLFDPGFQLSFAATWGIVSLAPHLSGLLHGIGEGSISKGLRDLIAVSLSAQLAVLPLCALYFQLVPLLGLIPNILVVPLSGLVVNLGLAGVLLGLFLPPVGNLFLTAAGALTVPIQGLLGQLARMPGVSVAAPQPPQWLVIAWYPLLLALSEGICGWREVRFPHFRFKPFARRYLIPSLIGLGFLLGVMVTGEKHWLFAGEGLLRVTFLSVGQGDAVLVELPNGQKMLVDAGGKEEFSDSSFDPGREIVVPYLIRSGVRRLDVLVGSHPHGDHIGGMPAVLDEIPVKKLLVPPVNQATPLLRRVEDIACKKQIPLYRVHKGCSLKLDPRVSIDVLSPPETPYSGTDSDPNNNSIVLLVRYGGFGFLLTGDAESPVLDRIAADELPLDAAVNVLKAPHHGSSNGISKALAERLHPRFVVISVGRNAFGHPDPRTLDFWRENGACVLRTDESGAVIFESDGRRLWLRVYRQSPKLMPMARAA
ncbi:MAG: DNA internalization-related competence protein ComEC/Rec2 [Thermacetogeniaceae bacterium]